MKPGDKVVCVDFHRNEYYCVEPALLRDTVYVVSEVGQFVGEDYVNLVGVKAPYSTVGWRARRFRKLDELKAVRRNLTARERDSVHRIDHPAWYRNQSSLTGRLKSVGRGGITPNQRIHA